MREHLANVAALVAMSAYALKNDGTDRIRKFPVFMWDGRTRDAGMDKSWHFTNHAMMTYVLRFDVEHGGGEIAKQFTAAVEHADTAGTAQRIAKTYDERKGALGGFVGWVVPGPSDESHTLYAPPPRGFNAAEQRAYHLAVTLGDTHEYKTSGGDVPVSLDDIGDDSKRWDPLCELHARFDRVWGLQDHGVARDLTANRLGAQFAIELYRSPSAQPTFPFDEGKAAKNGAYAAGTPISFAYALGEELVLLDALGGTAGSNARFEVARTVLTHLGKDGAVAQVRTRLALEIDQMIADPAQHDRLAQFYGNHSIRAQRFGERVQGYHGPDGGYWHEGSPGHTSWARDRLRAGEGDQVKGGILSRFDAIAASLG
jgi:hypothetical protein